MGNQSNQNANLEKPDKDEISNSSKISEPISSYQILADKDKFLVFIYGLIKENDFKPAFELFKVYENKYHKIDEFLAESMKQVMTYFEKKHDYESAIEICKTLIDNDRYLAIDDGLNDKLTNLQELYNHEKTEIEIALARLEERNKVISDLSHSIKNLIASTVIEPLLLLEEEQTLKPQIIRQAIQGSNLIREIVNAMNLSFVGSIDDFKYDANNPDQNDTHNLMSIIHKSVIYSLSNIFNNKYYSKFSHNYFTRELFFKAKSEWSTVSKSSELQELLRFVNKYFLDITIDIDESINYKIGDAKGSAIKLLILFQEIIFNSIKYSSFVNQEDRFLKVKLSKLKNKIMITAENSFDPSNQVKTSGIGHVLIENFSKLLNSKPTITKDDKTFILTIKFPNFWEEDKS